VNCYSLLDVAGKRCELQIDKALAATNFRGTAAGRTSPLPLPTEEGDRWLLAACRYFATERRVTAVPFTARSLMRTQAAIVSAANPLQ
jgi:hypothetical protein